MNVANKRLDDLKQDHCVRVNDLEARVSHLVQSNLAAVHISLAFGAANLLDS